MCSWERSRTVTGLSTCSMWVSGTPPDVPAFIEKGD
jgi:hypothetical protein